MTVCIAAYCNREEAFVCAVDQMLSASDISADSLAIKYSALGGRWICMFSASDISAVTSIVGRVQAELAPASAPEEAGDVIASFKKAFDAERKKKIEATVLAPGMNLEEFYRVGLEKLGGEIFSRTYNLLETVQLGVSFLVCGFSAGARPHLFVFTDPGIEQHYDLAGFWAIGSGTNNAIGSLFNLKGAPLKYRSFDEVIYRVCEAKFYSETAPGVGRETSVVVLKYDSRFIVDDPSKLRAVWEKNSNRPLPDGVSDAIAAAGRRDPTARKVTRLEPEK